MKYKKKLANLQAARKWFEALPEREKSSLTKPGSVKQRTGLAV